MPNNERLLTTYDSALLNKIGQYVGHTLIAIQKQQPELLLEKYRNVQWYSYSNQSALSAKFTELLGQTQDWDVLVQKLQMYLKALFVPKAFNSPILLELIANIQQLKPEILDLNDSINIAIPPSSLQIGIAVLLLDAENLQLNPKTEKFLTTVCACPIQVKIAFANWCNRGKLDVELHERGYDLIHVPAGKDNADGKMIAVGSSIHERYPNAKEVLVCSSDKVMTNLCNHLQQHGLTAYQVSQQGENIKLFNSFTGKITTYNLKPSPEMPSIADFIQQLKTLIKDEQKSTGNQWIQLSKLSQILNTKYKLTISQVVSAHFPGKKARDIFIDYPSEFVVHQYPDKSELYVTLFEINQDNSQISNNISGELSSIKSQADLEQVMQTIIKELAGKSPQGYVNISGLNSKFQQQYGKSITEQLKTLHISGKFLKFLQSCSSLTLKQTQTGWEVAVR
jgi:hypothetical protein